MDDLSALPMEQVGETTWLVQSSGGDRWYQVKFECTCPDFESRHRVCKHIRQLLVYLGRANETD